MTTLSQAKVANITMRLHKKRGMIQENMELRHKMLKASYHMQLQNDRNAVMSHINHLPAGPRKLYLQMRLDKINTSIK